MIKLFNQMIKCNSCEILKPISEYYPTNKSRCKKCLIKQSSMRLKNIRKKGNPNYNPKSKINRYLMSLNLRQCYKCIKIKSINDFNRGGIDGRQYICKACQKEYYRNWYIKNGKKRKRNIKSDKVRHLVKKAIDNGNLIKLNYCEICNRNGDIRAHHYDYSKPLDVIWVGRSCHRLIHTNHLDKIDNIYRIQKALEIFHQ